MRSLLSAAVIAFAASGAQAATMVNWVDWTAFTANSATGTMTVGSTTVGVTMTNSVNNAFVITGAGTNYWTTPTSYTSTNCTAGAKCAANGPPASDIVALSAAGTVTISFDKAVKDVYFAFTSWNGQSAVDYTTTLELLSYGPGYWGNGTPSLLDSDTVSHAGETHGTLLLPGNLNGFAFTTYFNENWHGFTIGTAGLASPGPSPIPLPAAGWLLLSGFGGLAALRARRRAA